MSTYTRRRAEADSFEGVDKDPGRVQAGKRAIETRKYYEGEDVMREQGRKGGEARRGSSTSDDLSSMASYFHTLDTKDRRRVQAGKQAAETRRQREGEDVFREMGAKGGRARAGGRDDEDYQGQDGSAGKRTRDRDTSDRDEDEQDSGYQKRRRSLDQGKDQRRVEAGKKAAETRKAREGEDVMREQGRKGGQARRGRGGRGRGEEDEDQGEQDGQEDRHEQRVRAGKKGAAARWGRSQDDEDQGQDEDMGHESRHEQHVRAGKKGAAARWGKSQDDEDQEQGEDSGQGRRGARRQGRGDQEQGGDDFDYPDPLTDDEFVDAVNHNKNPNRVLAGKKTAVMRRAQEGPDVFSRMGRAGAEARRTHTRDQGDRDRDDDQSESEHEQEVYIHRVLGGMKGARTRMEREGPDVFSRMGKAGAEARWGHPGSSRDRDDTDQGQDEDNQSEHEQEVHTHRVIGGIKAARTRKMREGPEIFHEMGRMGAAARWGSEADQGKGRAQQSRGGSRNEEEEEEYQSDHDHDREVHMHRVMGGKKGTMKREYGDDIHHRLGEMGARARWGR